MSAIRTSPSVPLICALLLLIISSAGPGLADQQEFIRLTDFTTALEKALVEAQQVSVEKPYFLVQKVKLSLRGTNRAEASGGLSFSIPVFKVGADLKAKGTESQETTLIVELVPRESRVVGGAQSLSFAPLVRTLKDAFKGDARLRPRSVEYSQKWALQRDAGGNINVVVAKLGVEISQENSQEVTLFLCETENRADCIR